MHKVALCNYKSPEIEIHVYASIIDGQLKIEGQDLGGRVEDFWGDDEYEYFYMLSKENTTKLQELLEAGSSPDMSLLEHIKANFSGIDGCQKFRDFCDKHSIQYEFFSC